jgi:hypothetical protein
VYPYTALLERRSFFAQSRAKMLPKDVFNNLGAIKYLFKIVNLADTQAELKIFPQKPKIIRPQFNKKIKKSLYENKLAYFLFCARRAFDPTIQRTIKMRARPRMRHGTNSLVNSPFLPHSLGDRFEDAEPGRLSARRRRPRPAAT